MNISWQWLSELVDLNGIKPQTLSDKLTLAGFEIENMIKTEEDIIFDISYTSNRSDTSNIIGIAKEISSICNRTLNTCQGQLNIPLWQKSIESNKFNEEQYIISKIENIHIQESPYWLKQKLANYNIQSVNNVNDIINLIAIKWSHHIQILYIDTQNGIVDIGKLKHIDTNRKISELLLKQTSDIAIGKQNILVQLSLPQESVRQKLCSSTQKIPHLHNLYKTNKYINRQDQLEAYSEAIILLTGLGKTSYPNQIIYLSTQHKIRKPIQFNYQKNDKILGPVQCHKYSSNNQIIKRSTIHNIFNNLYFIIHDDKHLCYIDIPTYRISDIHRDIDLIEEISRIHGFNMFIDKLPQNSKGGQKSIKQYQINQIRSICRSIGLHEVIHSSLGKTYNTEICNPLTQEYSSLRDKLLPKLIHSYKYNIKQNKKAIEIFEIGKIFTTNEEKYIENIHLAGILGGNRYIRAQWNEQPKNISWFQAKGDIEEIFERLNIDIKWRKKNTDTNTISSIYSQLENTFKRNNYSTLYNDTGQAIGLFGELKTEDNNLQLINPLYGFEIILDNLVKYHSDTSFQQFKQYTKYPSIIRDIKIEVPKKWPIDKIFDRLNQINEPLIESIELFDVYNIRKQETLNKSLGFRITYTNKNATLTTEEVDIVEQRFRNISVQ
uniref:phenylalanine--tRNA ligase n=1 Tax=Helminthora furcellata TaxID=1884666 RepID=A0A1G4NRI6_9FLOR|nr:Phenylalanine-tRNA ligase beta subunit [Helminthora furcellata]SCW21234.1 Phenylalanine-tRNA ligase beta subunit [Helminthora furcellata]SCW24094.1 Phenylalanine-tRNA ligase beta subunit [Helminthora furcellata]